MNQAEAAIRRAGVRVIVALRVGAFAIGFAADRIERTTGLAAALPAVR
jgi:hypothetical protein